MDPSSYPGLSQAGGQPQPQAPPVQLPGMGPVGPGYAMPAPYLQQFAATQAQAEQLRRFWAEMKEDAQRAGTDPLEFKNQNLPLARIKKIMKSDEDVRMISAEAPVLFAKACEYFILELTLRAWSAAEETKRRTLQRSDIATAIARTDIFDFLVDIVPREEANPPPAAAGAPGAPVALPPQFMPQFMSGAVPGPNGAGQQPPNGSASQVAMPGPPGNVGMPPPAMFGMGGMPPGFNPAMYQQAAAAAVAAAAAAAQQQGSTPAGVNAPPGATAAAVDGSSGSQQQ